MNKSTFLMLLSVGLACVSALVNKTQQTDTVRKLIIEELAKRES